MDDLGIYQTIARSVIGVVFLMAMAWGALRYVVKYEVFRKTNEMKEYTDEKMNEVWNAIRELQAYDQNLNDLYLKLQWDMTEMRRERKRPWRVRTKS